MTLLLRSVQLGAATGLRSMAAPWQLASGVSRTVFLTMAIGEMVADKTPLVPDRTAPAPLVVRAVLAAVMGAMLARRLEERESLGAMLGAAGAVAAAHAGYRVRHWLTKEVGVPDLAVALAEDAASIAISHHAIRGRTHT